jgi:transposase
MLSFVLTNKFCDHLPYYRQQAAFARQGIEVSRQDMSVWQEKVYEKLMPMEALMTSYLKTGPYIQMDGTTCRVFGEPEREDTQKPYMWLARGGPVKHPVVIYRYYPTRGAANIRNFITGYSGFLQTDGYEAYNTALSEHIKTNPGDHIIHVGCLAHARRKFFDAAKVSSKSKSADEAMKCIRDIYRKETELREQNPEPGAFVAARKKQIIPMLKTFHEWLIEKAQHVPPPLALGKAVNYMLGQWEHITAYLGCPGLTPDNNASENAIRPFVLGRKNWLFSGSPDGARSSCMLYLLIESAKEKGLNPQEYLRCVFESAPFCSTKDDWKSLMPWNIQITSFIDRGVWIN